MAIEDIDNDDAFPASGQNKADLGPLPSFPGYLLRQAQLRVAHGAHKILDPYGIRFTQFGVLILLKYNPGIRPSEAAEALGLKRANFVPLLDDLRERGLAETLPRPDDRRARAVRLTQAGVELMGKIEAEVTAFEHSVMAKIDPGHTGMLAEILAKVEGIC